MIRRLLEADYFGSLNHADLEQIEFWLRELRTPELLIEVAGQHPEIAKRLTEVRPLLRYALFEDEALLIDGLASEERAERDADKEYWRPLKAELEQLRLDRRKN